MEDLWSKYDKIKEVFYRDFVYDSSYTEQASCIPLSSVKNGVGWVGDGTINLAQYLQLVNKFNKSLEGGELFMPHLVFLHGCEDVDRSSLESYLKEWEWDEVNSPIEFLTLCNWYKIFFSNENIL